MKPTQLIIFVCEHGAAKSIVAAAHFNKLAADEKLDVRAIARGTTPEAELSLKAVAGLNGDGLTPTESVPQKLSLAEFKSAQQIISFCELPEEYQGNSVLELWDGVPLVSEDYEKARDVIFGKVNQLINEIT